MEWKTSICKCRRGTSSRSLSGEKSSRSWFRFHSNRGQVPTFMPENLANHKYFEKKIEQDNPVGKENGTIRIFMRKTLTWEKATGTRCLLSGHQTCHLQRQSTRRTKRKMYLQSSDLVPYHSQLSPRGLQLLSKFRPNRSLFGLPIEASSQTVRSVHGTALLFLRILLLLYSDASCYVLLQFSGRSCYYRL